MKNLYFVPFYFDDSVNTGVNFSEAAFLKKEKIKEFYLKNCCVALLSARKKNEDDIALVTNIDVPDPYLSFLNENNIKIIKISFKEFRFNDQFKWSAAFFKFNALKYVVDNLSTNYKNVMFTDCDVFCQLSFKTIWKECESGNILLYDLEESDNNSQYVNFLKEVEQYSGEHKRIIHYGGEFYCSSIESAQVFVSRCEKVYDKLIKKGMTFSTGDEFITSIVAESLRIKNSGPFIFRFWTGSFRVISTRYKFNPLVFLHCPDEKERGLIFLFKYYKRHNKFPSNNKIYRKLNLSRPRFRTVLVRMAEKIFKKYKNKPLNQ